MTIQQDLVSGSRRQMHSAPRKFIYYLIVNAVESTHNDPWGYESHKIWNNQKILKIQSHESRVFTVDPNDFIIIKNYQRAIKVLR